MGYGQTYIQTWVNLNVWKYKIQKSKIRKQRQNWYPPTLYEVRVDISSFSVLKLWHIHRKGKCFNLSNVQSTELQMYIKRQAAQNIGTHVLYIHKLITMHCCVQINLSLNHYYDYVSHFSNFNWNSTV